MATTTGSFGEYLEEGLRQIFASEDKKMPLIAESLVRVESSSKQTEHFITEGGFGAPTTLAETEGVTYDDPIQGYKKNMTQVRYGMGFQVTEDMLDFDQYGRIKSRPKKLARSMKRHVETIVSNLWNNGFTATTGTLTADALAWFHISHTLLRGSTYANKPTTDIDLCVSGIEAALTNLSLVVDDASVVTPYAARILLVHPNNLWTAKKLLGSEKDPVSANNTINPLKGELEIVSWPYLTDTDAWFIMCAKEERDHGPMLLWSKKPDFVTDTDSDNRTNKFNSIMRFATGVVDWRGMYGSSGG